VKSKHHVRGGRSPISPQNQRQQRGEGERQSRSGAPGRTGPSKEKRRTQGSDIAGKYDIRGAHGRPAPVCSIRTRPNSCGGMAEPSAQSGPRNVGSERLQARPLVHPTIIVKSSITAIDERPVARITRDRRSL
jgi:hypothetical protein